MAEWEGPLIQSSQLNNYTKNSINYSRGNINGFHFIFLHESEEKIVLIVMQKERVFAKGLVDRDTF